jgi:hypothetical protein
MFKLSADIASPRMLVSGYHVNNFAGLSFRGIVLVRNSSSVSQGR